MLLQQGTARVPARVLEVVHRTDPETLEAQPASQLALNEIGLVRLETARVLVFDRYRDNRQTGCFVLIDDIRNLTLGAGMVERAVVAEPLSHETTYGFHSAPPMSAGRLQRYGHRPAVVLLRSGALRKLLEQALFARGAAVANLRALPAIGQVQDLLASGLILLAPPDGGSQPDAADWIEVAEAGPVKESVNAVLFDLERRGVLVSRGLVFPGEGI
jgi:hypothetical protein